MLRELVSMATSACKPDVSRVINALNTVRSKLHMRLSIVPSNCPTISKTGLMIMLGFPPAIPTNSISMNMTRRICSMNPSGELASIAASPIGDCCLGKHCRMQSAVVRSLACAGL